MKKIMKNLKKIPTLLMLMLAIVMSVPNVFAETKANASTAENTDAAGAIKISGIEEDKKGDVTISAYQLMTTNLNVTYQTDDEGETVLDENDNPVIQSWQPKQPIFTWNANVANWLRSQDTYKAYVNEDNDNVTPAFTKCEGEDTDACVSTDEAKAFYDDLAAAIKTLNVPVKKYKETASGEYLAWSEEGDSTVISGLEMGNHLVLIENGVNIYSPSAINVVPTKAEGSNTWTAGDTQLKVKYTTPSIDKEITSETPQGGIGSTVDYKITVQIPQYPEKATAKKIEITDTLTGLTLNASTIKVKVDDAEITSGFTKTTTTTGFTITFEDSVYDTVLRGHTTIVVEYSGTIAETAVVGSTGNSNHAVLKYNNNPYDSNSFEPLSEDTEKVYTYGVKITKIKEGTTTVLPGAKFSVYTSKTGGTALGFISEGNGVYRRAKDGEEGIVYELEVGSTGKNEGILEVKGLAEGTYWFEETEAPEGYVKLQQRVDVTLTDKETTEDEEGNSIDVWDGILAEDGETEDGYAEKEIPNNDNIPVLPVTGGIGTILFSVLGIVFMGLGAFLIKNIFKKEDVQ